MRNNLPTEVQVVGVLISGFYRPRWMGFGDKKEVIITYKVSSDLNRFDESSGVGIEADQLFPSKQALLDSYT
jgi:hypothetical protein